MKTCSSFMILSISIVTLFLTIILTYSNYSINKNSFYLSGLLFLLSISGLMHYYIIFSDSAEGVAITYTHFMPLLYLQGPLLYFYVSGTLKDKFEFGWRKLIHFLPSLIAFISVFDYYFKPWSFKLGLANKIIASPHVLYTIKEFHIGNQFINIPARTILLILYGLFSIVLLLKYSVNNKLDIKQILIRNKTITWLYFITINVVISGLSYLLMIIKFMNERMHTRAQINEMSMNYISAFSFFLIPISILILPSVLYGIPIVDRKKIATYIPKNKIAEKPNLEQSDKVENLEMEELTEAIQNYLKTEKPFIDPKFSLDDLAKQLDVPKHHLYYCLNSILNTKFTTLRTQMRVEYAKELLLNGALESFSMEGLWTKTGFSSRTNFFVTFKEATGYTPLEFIKINIEK
jgi:AraC-like DNA-binding protein